MKKDIGKWAQQCTGCQVNKVPRHTRTPPEKFNVPDKILVWSHIDLVGPLPPSCGFMWIMTIIDRTTRYLEAIPLRDAKARTVADAYLLQWVAKFGVPGHLTSDRGVQFTSQLWEIMAKDLRTKLHQMTAYHPAANGLVERQNRKMKDALKSKLEGRPNWSQELWAVLLGMRTSPRADIGASTAELVFGAPITVPGDLITAKDYELASGDLLKRIRQIAAGRTPTQTSAHNNTATYTPKDLRTCDYVFVRVDKVSTPLAAKYTRA